jgi:hypothetical protein
MILALQISRTLSDDWHGSYGSVPAPGHSNRDRDRGVPVPDSEAGDDLVIFIHHGDDWRVINYDWRHLGLSPERLGQMVCKTLREAASRPTLADAKVDVAAKWAKASCMDIYSHNDATSSGQEAAAQLAERWTAADQPVWTHTPSCGDFTDQLGADDNG